MTHVVRVALEPVPVHNQEEYRCIVVTTGMDQYLAYTPLAHPQIDDAVLLEALAQSIQLPVRAMLCLGRGDLRIQQNHLQLEAFCPDGMPLDKNILAIFMEPLREQFRVQHAIVA